jgi:hypothetical protein
MAFILSLCVACHGVAGIFRGEYFAPGSYPFFSSFSIAAFPPFVKDQDLPPPIS